MREDDRIAQLKADAEALQETHPDIAYRLKKAITLVIDRDAGPNIDAKSQLNDMAEALAAKDRELADLRGQVKGDG